MRMTGQLNVKATAEYTAVDDTRRSDIAASMR